MIVKWYMGLWAVIASVLMTLPTPTVAAFESTTGKSQGPINTYPETTTFQTVEGGPAITCKSTNSKGEVVAKGGWIIQVKTQTQQGKYFYQAPALKGPREQLKIETFGICIGPTGLPVETSCNFQVESNGASSLGTGSVYPPGCIQKFGSPENSCAIIAQPDGNKELSEVRIENGGAGVEIKDQTQGISSIVQESKELCKTLGVKGGQKTGKHSSKNPLVTEGQKLI